MGAETNASNNEPDAVKVKGGPDTIEPTDSDVLSGRGGLTNHHPGNKRYRKWVELHKDKYRKGSMNEKTKIARQIIQLVRNQSPPGRFLKRDCKTKPWFELTEERSERKTKQALRENKETEQEGGLMPAGLRPVSATDPSAPKLVYGDPLLMAPPKLLCGEVQQVSIHDDLSTALAAAPRPLDLRCSRITDTKTRRARITYFPCCRILSGEPIRLFFVSQTAWRGIPRLAAPRVLFITKVSHHAATAPTDPVRLSTLSVFLSRHLSLSLSLSHLCFFPPYPSVPGAL